MYTRPSPTSQAYISALPLSSPPRFSTFPLPPLPHFLTSPLLPPSSSPHPTLASYDFSGASPLNRMPILTHPSAPHIHPASHASSVSGGTCTPSMSGTASGYTASSCLTVALEVIGKSKGRCFCSKASRVVGAPDCQFCRPYGRTGPPLHYPIPRPPLPRGPHILYAHPAVQGAVAGRPRIQHRHAQAVHPLGYMIQN